MIKYERALEEEKTLRDIVETLKLDYIDLSRVRIVYSYGANTRAIARIWAIPKIILETFELKPVYVIELITEKFLKLSEEEKIKVIIHEVLHIPSKFSGGLRPHGNKVSQREVNKLYKKYLNSKSKKRNS
ncbi:putative metallopeptidase [Saccharolobus caldissimus]|uniref:Metallopeptidase n=1 Tax=Saccharolobus caldissimus TaxID=1702097 RepID=A0AAQ4CVW6_9CREN|nr:putative metallopeptidase [Saccharolobus caldissimus]BDB99947.1 metallopeptidase [Saccharolobus caldissimus]